ncbi:ENTH-domain-containing protein [Peniophora sp. CONT]|nr:ENTH-domain-containing protein [Peniophora sp. CONT]
MSIQHFGKGALRVAKNYTKGYSDVQAKVREATSNDAWGPSGTQMNEIAQMSYNQNDFVEIMEMLDKRLNDKGKNWRHVFKSLTVLDYLLHAGSENVVIYFRDNIYIIKTLKEFQFVDEFGKDQGANVRQKAKDITNLLQDDARLRQERRSRAHMRDRMLGANGEEEEGGEERPRPQRNGGAGVSGKDDDELRKAIEASKRSLAAEQAKTAEERDLAQALKLSEEEEAKRLRDLQAANNGGLFDDQANQQPDLLQIDAQPFVQPQYTIQPQFTSFNPYAQQAQQEAAQAEYLRQQQEWLAQQQQQQQLAAQQEEWLRQQQQQQYLQQQQQQQYLQQQQLLAQQQLIPQQTSFGTNNPFAATQQSPSPFPSSPAQPQQNGINFNLPSTYDQHSQPQSNLSASLSSPPQQQHSPAPSASPSRGPTRTDQEHAHLANLFAGVASGDGVDTFGNVGQLRYGGTDQGRLAAQRTGAPGQGGHNPFAPQQQQQQGEQPFFSI